MNAYPPLENRFFLSTGSVLECKGDTCDTRSDIESVRIEDKIPAFQ